MKDKRTWRKNLKNSFLCIRCNERGLVFSFSIGPLSEHCTNRIGMCVPTDDSERMKRSNKQIQIPMSIVNETFEAGRLLREQIKEAKELLQKHGYRVTPKESVKKINSLMLNVKARTVPARKGIEEIELILKQSQ